MPCTCWRNCAVQHARARILKADLDQGGQVIVEHKSPIHGEWILEVLIKRLLMHSHVKMAASSQLTIWTRKHIHPQYVITGDGRQVEFTLRRSKPLVNTSKRATTMYMTKARWHTHKAATSCFRFTKQLEQDHPKGADAVWRWEHSLHIRTIVEKFLF